MQIAFVTAEVSPFAKTGGLGDVCGALPKALERRGHDVVVFTPFYRETAHYFSSDERAPEAVGEIDLAWDGWKHILRVYRATLPGSKVPIYFFANDYLYNREHIYAYRWDGGDDQLERFTVLCRAAIRMIENLGLHPEILHAHDWHTAVLPLYLHSGLRSVENFGKTASVFTIHNLNYQGRAPRNQFRVLGLHERYWQWDALDYYGDVLPMKGGILFADQVTTVSPTYAWEIQGPELGAGLDGTLREEAWKLTGILNGIDVEEWNPATDPHLGARFDRDSLERRSYSRDALREEAHLSPESDRMLIGVVSRLVSQKGFDALLPVLSSILDRGAQLVLLGSGEEVLENAFRHLANLRSENFCAWIKFDNRLAHRITAGADVILMPSRYEPCGLNQMYALRYGALPLVHMTGGLADTVVPYTSGNEGVANGFGFFGLRPDHLLATVEHAMATFHKKAIWRVLQQNGMSADFSWDRSAAEYETVYRRALATDR